ncbi:MAG: phosphoadenylyl-sulfate reductase [Betaproteobacteria bacterium]|jgi:phosphoadenylylsulfate reductase (thioredoxin) (EC 1.8.4.8)|nr:phosphoadenylyl-sulfate reductase [Betaproteobacteria bacterium]
MLNDKIERLEQRLTQWSGQLSPLGLASSLGAEDMVLTDAICRLDLNISIFTLDTGRLPPSTYRLVDRVYERYGRRLAVYWPDAEAVEQLVLAQGMNGFYNGLDQRRACCQVRKVEVLQRALKGKKAWLTGLRREQSPGRQSIALEEPDELTGVIKLNPLVDWTHEDVWSYLKQFSVPYNPLHDQGYASIGCEPCTRALQPGEEERAGRWWWEQAGKKECGLHGGAPTIVSSTEKGAS